MRSDLQKNKKSYVINAIILVLVTGLSIFYLTRSNMLTLENLQALTALSVFVVLLYSLLPVLICALICFLVYRKTVKKWHYGNSVIDGFMGNLGSKITPYKLGHFPFRFYYQAKKQVKFHESLTSLTKTQIIYSVTSVIVYLTFTIVLAVKGTTVQIAGLDLPLWSVFLVGCAFHTGSTVGCFILSFSVTIQNLFITLLAKILFKLKKIKNIEEYVNAEKEKFHMYKEQVVELKNDWLYYLPLAFLYAVQMFISCSIPYIAYLMITGCAFNFNEFLQFYMLALAMNYANNVLPLPGGSGSAEVLFTLVYSVVISNDIVGSVMLLWRFCTFYFPIIVELIIFAVVAFYKGKTTPETVTVDESGEVVETAKIEEKVEE